VSHPIHLKPYHYLPVLLETQSPHYSAFLVIKSVKKANFSSFEPLNQPYLLSSELSDPSEAIPLLTCAFGDSEPHYSAFLVIKSVKKANFPPFEPLNQAYLLSSELSDPYEAIPSLTCAFGDSEPHYSAFLVIKSVKKAIFPLFEPLNQAYILSSELSNPPEAISLLTCAFGAQVPHLFRFFGHKSGQKGEFPSF